MFYLLTYLLMLAFYCTLNLSISYVILCTVQDRCPRLSMSSRPSTVVLVRRLPACLWLPTAPSPVIQFTVVCRSTCTQHVWWPVLCHCRAAGLELFAAWIATM